LRQIAARYARNFEAEYLPGLFLYSLAVVKYVDNHGAKAARLAFGTAGVVGGRTLKPNQNVSQQPFHSDPILDTDTLTNRQRNRLEQRLAILQQEWDLRNEKLERMEKALVIEVSIDVKFKYLFSRN
jgi:hypothetical protein